MFTSFAQILITLSVLPFMFFMNMRVRLIVFVILGCATLLVYSPASLWFLILVVLQALVLERILRDFPKKSYIRQYVPYVLLINIFYTDVSAGWLGNWNLGSLAVGFSVVRIFMTTKQLLGSRNTTTGERVLSTTAAAFFFPALAVGPIFSGHTLWKQSTSEIPEPPPTELQFRKLFGGWVLTSLVAQAVLLRVERDFGFPVRLTEMALLFINLFATFWGRSLIAEGTAGLAGFVLPQNFDKPWLARDIRDFWARWHISMAKFVTQYIFLPLRLRGLNPQFATFMAFVFMGFWHEVRPGYIIWGCVHGVLMAKAPSASSINSVILRFGYRIMTLSVVVGLSYTANYAFK